MSPGEKELGELVIRHLIDLSASKCTVSEADILEAEDDVVREILAGVLTLHEELDHREHCRQRATLELEELNDTLERRVAAQAQAIMVLSTRVIEVLPGILVLPLIGTVDSARAQQIMEQALGAVAEQGASVLIVDVTGVPVIDSEVTLHLLKTVEAVGLLGARAILSGVSPSNAQSLARLGADLSRIQTRGSLQVALQSALAMTNRAVVARAAPDAKPRNI